MKKSELQQLWVDIGKEWVEHGINEIGFKKGDVYKLSEKQARFVNSKKYFCLYSGGFGCGKSRAMIIKMILWCLAFPGTKVLLGRQFLSDIEKTILPDLFNMLPTSWYQHQVKNGIIKFFNNSEIILFGLDAFQAGSQADIKKAEQKIKGLNISNYFLDQLEEIEDRVFDALNARLRRTDTPFRQGNMTCNPANFWAYEFFKVNPTKRDDIELVEGSMLDNKAYLPPDYIEKMIAGKEENYVKRYVLGIWSPDVLIERTVFSEQEIRHLELMTRPPVDIEDGCEIFEHQQLGQKYQMGIDPSEGSVDPSSISIISQDGKKVAKFNGMVPINALAAKINYLYGKYNKPLIIPEVNAAGMALLEYIRDYNVYQRTVIDHKENVETNKLGWKTTYSSKQSIISNFKNLLAKGLPKIYDKQTIEQMKTFVWTDVARQQGAGAERGFHDDDIMSTLLGFWGLDANILSRNEMDRQLRFAQKQKRKITSFI